MLRFLGLDSEERLFDTIPEALRIADPLAIEDGKSEPETLRVFKRMAVANHGAHGLVNFLGGLLRSRLSRIFFPIGRCNLCAFITCPQRARECVNSAL